MFLPKPTESASFAPPPAGTFPAVCYRIIDLGTQESTYLGKPKKSREVLISWELADPDATTEDGKPMSIHQRFTWSMHEKSQLRKTLESWRGKAFGDSDFGEGGFDIRKLLGMACFIGITHVERNGMTYANVSAISKLPKNMDTPPQVNESVFLWLDKADFDAVAFAKLSEKLQDQIKHSPEYQKLVNGKPQEAIYDAEHVPFNDDVPF